MENVSWKLIDKMFKNNPNILVDHHLNSYNDFIKYGIPKIFVENNPIRFMEREEDHNPPNHLSLYLGGKNGEKIYYGKPIIYDDDRVHYMYPNEARLRNMTYGITIHYDVDVEITTHTDEGEKEHKFTLNQIYLGRFPIMLQSNLCLLKDLNRNLRFNMGECKNDYGGYFVIDGKEKVIICQEKFADNMINIKLHNSSDIYSHSVEIRSVSEDTSKPIRKSCVRIIAPSPRYTNNQIVVTIPNVKKHIPLFIVMRALGVLSDKDIIKTCLLGLDKNKKYIDLFIPSIHDANQIFTQQSALEYISTFTKRGTIMSVMEILSDYFLPHLGELNFMEKANYVGFMVFEMIKVYTKEEKPTDRDNFKYKRIELSGILLYELFREYYLLQKSEITRKISEEYYYHKGEYKEDDDLTQAERDALKKRGRKNKKTSNDNSENRYASNFVGLIESNFNAFFKERTVETGIRKAFKGSWGSQTHTKRVGIAQGLDRLSWNSAASQLRKINLPLDSSAKVVGPRLLNSSQWGYIDPIDTPDGGNIGLHKYLSLAAQVTSGTPGSELIEWLKTNVDIKSTVECSAEYMSENTKLFVNGIWVGMIEEPIELVNNLKVLRRNAVIPIYTSISFHYRQNIIYMYTDSGRLTRPIYYIENNKISIHRSKDILDLIKTNKITWTQIISGFKPKSDDLFNPSNGIIYGPTDLYSGINTNKQSDIEKLKEYQSMVDYIDTSEEETLLIANKVEDLNKSKYYTNIEIEPSLLLGIMGNQVIYPENNPATRSSFSCSQSKQAVSIYNSNFRLRIDKMGIILNSGQVPLIKSRYGEYLNNDENPYGVNAIVAIMSYTGYNVEDAILINKGAIDRGIFRTTYFSMYESKEESAKVSGNTNSKFANIQKNNVSRLKKGYDYSKLDDFGIIEENTPITDKTIVIGKIQSNSETNEWSDDSVKTKKGQLGFIDKSFITDGEEGFNVAKVRVREERIPGIGDKMASRAGQKGTLGMIVPEENIPFSPDGIKPDLIINPHALPSRMTLGQIVETLFGKVCTEYGAFGDCTAFQSKGPNYSTYGNLLLKSGFHSSGNQILYDAMSGEQLKSEIFIGPTYYMRLKHMVKDKINYRARGPNTVLTRQAVQGRANDGGLRIGEMERDGVISHGMSYFLNESFLTRGDEFYIAICNKTGSISIYNENKNLFISPMADGPLEFINSSDGNKHIKQISKFGRDFSIVKVPYSLKLLMHELLAMNIQMRLITDDNIDQINSMSYSTNINKLMKESEDTELEKVLEQYSLQLRKNKSNNYRSTKIKIPDTKENKMPELLDMDTTPDSNVNVVNAPSDSNSVPFASASPAYDPNLDDDLDNVPYFNMNPNAVVSESPGYMPEDMDNNIPIINAYNDDDDNISFDVENNNEFIPQTASENPSEMPTSNELDQNNDNIDGSDVNNNMIIKKIDTSEIAEINKDDNNNINEQNETSIKIIKPSELPEEDELPEIFKNNEDDEETEKTNDNEDVVKDENSEKKVINL